MGLSKLQLNLTSQDGGTSFLIDEARALKLGQHFGLEQLAPGRYCWMLLVDLILHESQRVVSTHCVIDEVRAMERGTSRTATKAASQFRHAPLYPLWHKHYFSAQFLPRNLRDEFMRDKTGERIVNEVCDPAKSEYITEEMIAELSHRVSIGLFETRMSEQRGTGEWLVFAKENGQNFYLCMATHDTPDQVIFDKLKLICRMQFPTLEPFASTDID